MIDESTLRERFARLRADERGAVPRFELRPRARKLRPLRTLIATTAALLLVAIVAFTLRPGRVSFSASDRAAARSVAEWHPPTDFLLRTPGSELLTTTPRIPDLKGIPR
ncbi:MAG: hypothetical protein QOI24_310 [Acidobacteriota bacterium]|jgi:hypothetical protein|nr:hypothetical protein [Acidobacteriota bacterium]